MNNLVKRFKQVSEELEKAKADKYEPLKADLLEELKGMSRDIFPNFPELTKIVAAVRCDVYDDQSDVYHDVYSVNFYITKDKYRELFESSKYFNEDYYKYSVHESELPENLKKLHDKVELEIRSLVPVLEVLGDDIELVFEPDSISIDEFNGP